MAEERGETQGGIDGRFYRLVATFEAAAMQQLGKIASPVTGDVEIYLDGARDSIDMLEMIRGKTDGNLNDDERRLLEHVLYQLRMNYVDVAATEQAREQAESQGAGARSGDSGDEPGGAEAGPDGSSEAGGAGASGEDESTGGDTGAGGDGAGAR